MKLSKTAISLTIYFALTTAVARAVDFGELVPSGEHLPVGQVALNGGWGTGTLIDKDIVVTAAHVVDTAQAPFAISFRVATTPPTEYQVIAYQINPGYYAGLPSNDPNDANSCVCNDVAVLRLATPVDPKIGVYQLPNSPLAADTLLTAVGYGINESKRQDDAKKMSGQLRFVGIKDRIMICSSLKEKYQRTDSGDSGGPLLVSQGNSWEIAGTVRGKDLFANVAGYTPDEYGQYVSTYRHREWIRETARALQAIPRQDSYVYLKRPLPTQNPQVAMTTRQVEGFFRAGTAVDRIVRKAAERGVSEPLPPDMLKLFAARINVREFVVLNFKKPAAANTPGGN
jgi:hypothetical protein